MLASAIDRYLRGRERPPREKGCFHPSDLHRRVSTLVSLYLYGERSQHFPARTLRIFDNGLSLQERLVRYFKEMGILVDQDVEATDAELEIRGTADCVVELAGHRRVVEIKSINSKGFSRLRSPQRAHLVQLNSYMHCLGIHQGILVYECKDNQELKEFNLGLDPAIVAGFTAKIKQAQHIIERLGVKELPTRPVPVYEPQPAVVMPSVIPVLPQREPGILAWFKSCWRYFRDEYRRNRVAW